MIRPPHIPVRSAPLSRHPILKATMGLRALGGLGRLGQANLHGTALILLRPPPPRPAANSVATRQDRLHLLHTIQMVLKAERQRIMPTPRPPRAAAPRPAPPRTVIELRILRLGERPSERGTPPAGWHRDVLHLLDRMATGKASPSLSPPNAAPRPPPRPPGQPERTQWFSTLNSVAHHLLERARAWHSPTAPRRERGRPNMAGHSAGATEARHPTYLVLAMPGQSWQPSPVSLSLTSYRPRQGTVLAYRRAPRTFGQEVHQQIQRITQQVHSKVVHEISQTSPWRTPLRDALRAPELLRAITDHVVRAVDRRDGIERYRRGL